VPAHWNPPLVYGPGKPKKPGPSKTWLKQKAAHEELMAWAATAPPLEMLALPPADPDALYWPMATEPKHDPAKLFEKYLNAAWKQFSGSVTISPLQESASGKKFLAMTGTAVEEALSAGLVQNGTLPSSWTNSGTEYAKVGRALGFTEKEIQALVTCNDSGVSFAVIAELIDSHPVVYSSALTPRRQAEEKDFVKRCAAKIRARGKQFQGYSLPEGVGLKAVNLTEFWANKPGSVMPVDDLAVLKSGNDGSLYYDPAYSPAEPQLWTPKTGKNAVASLAEYLGIWLPPQPQQQTSVWEFDGPFTTWDFNVGHNV